jgi:hypothetical protein
VTEKRIPLSIFEIDGESRMPLIITLSKSHLKKFPNLRNIVLVKKFVSPEFNNHSIRPQLICGHYLPSVVPHAQHEYLPHLENILENMREVQSSTYRALPSPPYLIRQSPGWRHKETWHRLPLLSIRIFARSQRTGIAPKGALMRVHLNSMSGGRRNIKKVFIRPQSCFSHFKFRNSHFLSELWYSRHQVISLVK